MRLVCLAARPTAAQATRTWVSGVGDDVNPCSRTAHCKTFAGAISKTAAGGEISVLDPGGFGGITITKSITINGQGTLGSTLVAFTNGVVINAGANDVITLRNLTIEGTGNGINGIRFLNGQALHVQNVMIRGFRGANGNGISFGKRRDAAEAAVRHHAVPDRHHDPRRPGAGAEAHAAFCFSQPRSWAQMAKA